MASPEVAAGRVTAGGGVPGTVELRLFESASDCADLFRLVVPDHLGFIREVGTVLRSAQSALCRRRHNAEYARLPRVRRHGETIHVVNHESRGPLYVPTQPATWHILGEYEYAPEDHATISLDAPAPEFFGPAPGNLNWNGRNGWTDNTGQLIAVLRHTVNDGQNELLIDAAWLEQWLTAEQKSLIWIENTGKDVCRGMGGGRTHPGRLTRSQVHSWNPGSSDQLAAPGWDRIPASGE